MNKNVPVVRFKKFTDNWEQRKLADIVDVCSGMDYKHLSAGNIPVYGTGGYMLSVDKALSYDNFLKNPLKYIQRVKPHSGLTLCGIFSRRIDEG